MSVGQLIYTDRPRGGGWDPNGAGYQIIACSGDLDTASRELLSAIALHYGEAVYRYAPREALDGESAWRSRTESLDHLPEDVLNAFPVIWSYDRLRDDLYALTRVRYTGLTHDGRFGNFFAHALTLAPDALDAHGWNPLALAHTGLFQDDPGGGTALPDLGPASGSLPDYPLLTGDPYAPHLAALVSALSTATPTNRPVVLCLPDWRQAQPLAEALLGLLPPSARCRTTLCTYESDRTWTASARTGRPAGPGAAHHLLVLCGPDDPAFGLRPDEVQSTYAVFNFVGNQFGPSAEPRPYAAFVEECVLSGRLRRLQQYQALLEDQELGQNVQAWDELLPAVALSDVAPRPEELAAAARALAAHARQARQAERALNRLWPHLQTLDRADQSADLDTLSADVSALADLLPGENRQATSTGFLADVHALARQALLQGRASTAAALLKLCGRAREGFLLALLEADLGRSPTARPLQDADRQQRGELFLEGLQLAQRASHARPTFAQLLVPAYQAAYEASLAGEAWRRTGGAVRNYLSEPWDKGKQDLARVLVRHLPALDCPDGSAWLNLKLLATTPLKGDDLLLQLEETARACSRCADAAHLSPELLRVARAQRVEPEAQAVALGRMAEAAHDTKIGNDLFTAYQEELRRLPPAQQFEVRLKLGRSKVVHVLVRELAATVLPWDKETSPQTLKDWQSQLLERDAGLLDGVFREMAVLVGQPTRAAEAFPLAEALIPPRTGKDAPPGLIALCGVVAHRLPLRPLPAAWGEALACVLEEPASAAASRLRILRLLDHIEKASAKPTWSVEAFPHGDPVWRRDVRALERADRTQVLAWCLDTLAASGVTTPAQAQALVQLLKAVGVDSEEQIAEAACRLLRGRDSVTCVVVITAFARVFLEGAETDPAWPGLVGTLAGRCDRMTRRLLLDHLSKRFCRAEPGYVERLRQLCADAGLPPVELAGTATGQDDGRWPGRALVARWVRRLWGSPDARAP